MSLATVSTSEVILATVAGKIFYIVLAFAY